MKICVALFMSLLAFDTAFARNCAYTKVTRTFFTTGDGCDLKWDLYFPPDTMTYPPPWNVVLVIYGGEFRGGSRTEVATECQDLAAAGFVAAAIDYRVDVSHNPAIPCQENEPVFAPPSNPNQPADVQKAVYAARYPDPMKNPELANCGVTGWVGAVGGSSGASHALWVASTGTRCDTRVDVAVLLSGAYLFSDPASLNYSQLLGCDPPLSSSFASEVTQYCQGNSPAQLNAGSPLNMMDVTVSPLLAFATQHDPVTPPQLMDLRSALSALGILNGDHQVPDPLPGSSHSFQYWNGDPECGTPAVKDQVISFLESHLAHNCP